MFYKSDLIQIPKIVHVLFIIVVHLPLMCFWVFPLSPVHEVAHFLGYITHLLQMFKDAVLYMKTTQMKYWYCYIRSQMRISQALILLHKKTLILKLWNIIKTATCVHFRSRKSTQTHLQRRRQHKTTLVSTIKRVWVLKRVPCFLGSLKCVKWTHWHNVILPCVSKCRQSVKPLFPLLIGCKFLRKW